MTNSILRFRFEGDGTPEFVDVSEDNIFFHRWDRVCELWFENNSAWTNAFISNSTGMDDSNPGQHAILSHL